jgi:hypothetical protein
MAKEPKINVFRQSRAFTEPFNRLQNDTVKVRINAKGLSASYVGLKE